MEVKVHVYDLPNAQATNNSLRSLGIGLYHSGLELRGFEYSFSEGGVSRTTPNLPMFGVLRETIVMGVFSGSMNDFQLILGDLRASEFAVGAYDLVYLNCNHFSNALCQRLTSRPLPEWVNRAAAMAASITPRPTLSAAPDPGGFAALGKVSTQSPVYGVGVGKLIGPSPVASAAAAPPVSSGSSSVFGWIGGLFGSTTAPPTAPSTTTNSSSSSSSSSSSRAPVVKVTLDAEDPRKKRELTQQQREMLAKLKAKK